MKKKDIILLKFRKKDIILLKFRKKDIILLKFRKKVMKSEQKIKKNYFFYLH